MVLDEVSKSANNYHRALYNQNVVNNWMHIQIYFVCLILVVSTALVGV
jgi:hypothetical protein